MAKKKTPAPPCRSGEMMNEVDIHTSAQDDRTIDIYVFDLNLTIDDAEILRDRISNQIEVAKKFPERDHSDALKDMLEYFRTEYDGMSKAEIERYTRRIVRQSKLAVEDV